MRSRLYFGHVMHARIEPVQHSFRYPAFVFALDLDELAHLDRTLRLFGHDRSALFSVHEADYLGAGDGGLRVKLNHWLERAGAGVEPHRVILVTTPRVAGHAFNPVSFYYCHDADDRVVAVVTEVNNTFGEGHVYVLDEPLPGPAGATGHLRFAARKSFHVSPFNDMAGDYEFDFAPLGSRLDVRIDIRREGGKVLFTRLHGTARRLDNAALWRLAATFPLNAALTLPRIVYQAFKLHYVKKLPVFTKPDPSSDATFRATRPAYIHEFSAPTWLQRRREPAEPLGSGHAND